MNRTMQQEAIRRINELTKKYDLTPSILEAFGEGVVCYSNLSGNGLIASVDPVSFKPEYAKAINDFEHQTGALVYHAIESQTCFGTLLSLLFVGPKQKFWYGERLYRDYIATYTINLTVSRHTEFGDITVGVSEPHGALIRRW